VTHGGYLNTYSFSKDSNKITLAPSSNSQLHKRKPQNTQTHSDLFLTFSKPLPKAFYHEFKAFKEWIITFLDESETATPTHPATIALLKQFSHVFLEEIPPGLPPKRFIQHHIDLILDAILPKTAYRMNLKETMEI